jgi:deazaflavin-dependent oxidoreductase (nitroreductase family)
MTQVTSVPPWLNKTMKFVLSSPLHGMVSQSTLLISFTGRKSGMTYTTPVSYSQHGDQVLVFTHASWWKNLGSEAPVTLRLRGRELRGLARPEAVDRQAIAIGLAAHLREVPFDARYYGVTFNKNGEPRPEEVEAAVKTVVMIRIRLC